MNRRWLCGLIGLICATSIGYTVSIVAATPEEMLRRPFSCSEQSQTEVKNFQVLTVRKWEKGLVALYRGECPGEKSIETMLGYRVVKRNGMEWQLSSTSSHKTNQDSKSQEKTLIEYGVGRAVRTLKGTANKQERHAVFYGQVKSNTVAAVEVTFNNGKVLRDAGLDGMLLLVSSGATGICDVRVLGVDNQILQRDELISPGAAVAGNTCQPISGQL